MRQGAIYCLSRLPRRIARWLWPLFKLGMPRGRRYFYQAAAFGRRQYFGGIVGVNETFPFLRMETYEPETFRVVAHLLPPSEKGLILDVGANAGQSLLLFKILCPEAPVHCFEPVGVMSEYLDELIRINGYSDCRSVHAALNDGSSAEETIHFGKSETLTASVAIPRKEHGLRATVPAMSLDAYAEKEKLGRVALLKIDVEGFEPEVIAGARRFLAERRPPILMEILYTEDAALSDAQAKMADFLRGLGYRFYLIGDGGVTEEQPVLRPDRTYRHLNYLIKAD